MKKILFILGLLISANVYAQPKQIYVGGDVLTVSGDTLYKNGVFLAELGGGSIDTTGQFVTAVEALNDTVARSKKGGVWTNFNIKGRNFHGGSGITRTGQTFNLGGTLNNNADLIGSDYYLRYLGVNSIDASNVTLMLDPVNTLFNLKAVNSFAETEIVSTPALITLQSFNENFEYKIINIDTFSNYGISLRGNDYGFSLPANTPTTGQSLRATASADGWGNPILEWYTPSGGGGSNFPTVDDTLTGNRFLYSDTYNLLFSHASGNAFTLSNTGLSYDIAGNNAILMNSSYNEIKTGNISTYGMLKTTNNTARLYTTDGTNTSTVVAHPKYVELDGKDSTLIKNIQEVAIDTTTQHVAVLQGNQLKKVKYNVLKADSTLTITGDSISVNLPKALKYREYVASLTQVGTDAPVATVLFNNLGDSVVWVYSGVGEYTAQYYNGGSSLDVLSDYASITNNVWFDAKLYIANVRTGGNTVVYTKDSGTLKDDLLGGISAGGIEHIITIRVYE